MNRFSWIAGLALIAGTLHAQQNSPHIGYVYPAGGQAGTTFEVIAGGQFLDLSLIHI